MYGEYELQTVCPWCIGDRSAHEKFGVEFVDRDLVGNGWDQVPVEVVDELACATPGFSGWQQERWFTHCADAAQFLGPMGKEQLQAEGAEAIEVIRLESGYEGKEWDLYYSSLNYRYGPGTAYLFKCIHCGRLGGYSDCH